MTIPSGASLISPLANNMRVDLNGVQMGWRSPEITKTLIFQVQASDSTLGSQYTLILTLANYRTGKSVTVSVYDGLSLKYTGTPGSSMTFTFPPSYAYITNSVSVSFAALSAGAFLSPSASMGPNYISLGGTGSTTQYQYTCYAEDGSNTGQITFLFYVQKSTDDSWDGIVWNPSRTTNMGTYDETSTSGPSITFPYTDANTMAYIQLTLATAATVQFTSPSGVNANNPSPGWYGITLLNRGSPLTVSFTVFSEQGVPYTPFSMTWTAALNTDNTWTGTVTASFFGARALSNTSPAAYFTFNFGVFAANGVVTFALVLPVGAYACIVNSDGSLSRQPQFGIYVNIQTRLPGTGTTTNFIVQVFSETVRKHT
jgi:hypothetical protein